MRKWIVAYDIPDDKRRRKVALLLENYGDRVQFSVFEILTDGQDLDGLLKKLRDLLEDEEDSVRLYPACDSCAGKVIVMGLSREGPWEEPDVYVL